MVRFILFFFFEIYNFDVFIDGGVFFFEFVVVEVFFGFKDDFFGFVEWGVVDIKGGVVGEWDWVFFLVLLKILMRLMFFCLMWEFMMMWCLRLRCLMVFLR